LEYQSGTIGNFDTLFASNGSGGDAFAIKWGWYATLIQLAQDDLRRLEEVTELPTHVVFQHLAYLKDYALQLKKNGNS
jgi:hypothetical protein